MENGRAQQTAEEWDFNIVLKPEEFKVSSDYWQEQCNILYNMIQDELPSGSIQPLTSKSKEGERADLVAIFSTLVVTGVAAKAIDKIVDIIKIWQESRPKAKITLKYADGSIVELSNLSVLEAKKTMKENQKKLKKK